MYVCYSTRMTIPLGRERERVCVCVFPVASVLFIATPQASTIVSGIHEMLSKSLFNACQNCGFFFFSLSPPKADLLCFSHSKPCTSITAFATIPETHIHWMRLNDTPYRTAYILRWGSYLNSPRNVFWGWALRPYNKLCG